MGFQAWAGGDPKKPLVTDPTKACFTCHTPQKSNDYTFSTYLHSRLVTSSSFVRVNHEWWRVGVAASRQWTITQAGLRMPDG